MFYFLNYEFLFKDLIDKYALREFYAEKCSALRSSASIPKVEVLNKNALENLSFGDYTYDFIRIPTRVKEPAKLNSNQGVLKYCVNHRSGPRMARLSQEMSKLVHVAEEKEKEDDPNK